MKIGDRCFVHGYVDEIRKDVVIIKNKGGYFGTDPGEVITVTDTAHPNWIPCSERLPEINQIVLLSTNSNNVYVGYRNKPELLWQVEEDGRKQWVYDPESYDVDIDVLPKTEDIDFYCEGVNDGGFLSITSANYNDRFEGVTAWMPLPEPYREDGHEAV